MVEKLLVQRTQIMGGTVSQSQQHGAKESNRALMRIKSRSAARGAISIKL